jgi:hypothetical protein
MRSATAGKTLWTTITSHIQPHLCALSALADLLLFNILHMELPVLQLISRGDTRWRQVHLLWQDLGASLQQLEYRELAACQPALRAADTHNAAHAGAAVQGQGHAPAHSGGCRVCGLCSLCSCSLLLPPAWCLLWVSEGLALTQRLARRTCCRDTATAGRGRYCAAGRGRCQPVGDVSALPLELRCHAGEKTCALSISGFGWYSW